MNVGSTHITKVHHRAVDLVDPEEVIFVTTMSDIEFYHPRTRVCSLRGTVTGRSWQRCDLLMNIGRWGLFHGRSRDSILLIRCLGVPRVIRSWTQVAKCWQDFAILFSLEEIGILKWREVFAHFDEPGDNKVRCRHSRQCVIVERSAKSAAIGNAGAR